jgi:hypothetical protein
MRFKCLERYDRPRVLNAGYDLHLLINEMADVGRRIDVKLDQEVEISGGGVDLGSNFSICERIGDRIGLAELAFDLNKKRNHYAPPCPSPLGSNSAKASPAGKAGSLPEAAESPLQLWHQPHRIAAFNRF